MKGTKPHLVIDSEHVRKAPPAPSWMSKDAKAEWRRVIGPLVERKILTEADLGGLENYCIAIGRTRELERLLKDGFDAPLFRAQDKAMQTARQLAAELGLTPVSRSRPVMRDDGDDDSLLD